MKHTTQKKKTSVAFNSLAIACLAALIILSASLIVLTQQNYDLKTKLNQQNNQQNQTSASAAPSLVSKDLNYTDNHSDPNAQFLQITGYVVNVGNASAYNCTLHVNALQPGNVTALDTFASLGELDAGASTPIDLKFTYTGQPLVAYSSYLAWTS